MRTYCFGDWYIFAYQAFAKPWTSMSNLGGTPESTNEILEFKISNFNIVAAVLGGFLTLFGLVSYLLKEKFYLGEACTHQPPHMNLKPQLTNV